MTDSASSLTVVLTENIRVDDLEPLITAIMMLKGVHSVGVNISDPYDYVAKSRYARKTIKRLEDVIIEIRKEN